MEDAPARLPDQSVPEQNRPEPTNFRTRIAPHLDLVILASFLLAALIRVYAFAAFPPGLHQDEASPAYDAFALLHYGVDRNGFHNPLAFVAWGSGMSALTPYLVMPFIALFGLNAYALHLPFLLAGLAAIPLFAWLVYEIDGLRAARVAAFLLAICPWHIVVSRWAHESNLLPFVLLVGVLLAVRSLSKPWALPASAALFGLALYTYGTAMIAVPIYLAVTVPYVLIHRRWPLQPFLTALAIFALISVPAVLFVLINATDGQSIVTPWFSIPRLPGVPRFETVTNVQFWKPGFLTSCVQNIRASAWLLLVQNDGLIWNVVPGFGLIYLFSLPLTLLGFVLLCRQCLQRTFTPAYFLLTWALTTLVMCVIVSPNVNRLNVGLVPLVYCTAIGVSFIQERYRLVFRGVIGVYAVAFLAFAWTYATKYPAQAGLGFYASLNEAVAAAAADPQAKVWVADQEVGVPYIFVLFANREDPREFLRTVQYANPGAEFQLVSSFGRYLFGKSQAQTADIDVYVVADGTAQFSPDHFKTENFGSFLVLRKRRP